MEWRWTLKQSFLYPQAFNKYHISFWVGVERNNSFVNWPYLTSTLFFWSTQLAVSQFSNQGLNPSHSRESLESYPLDDQGTPHDYLFLKRSLVGYKEFGTSLVVQLLRLHTSSVGGVVQSLVRKWRSHMGSRPKKKNQKRTWVPAQEEVLRKESDNKPGKDQRRGLS